MSGSPIAASGDWRRYVEATGTSTARPVAIASTSGDVSDAKALVVGKGAATLSYRPGQTPPVVVLDYGKEVGGLPFFHVASVAPGGQATSVRMTSGYSESRQYLLTPGGTATAADTPAGASTVHTASISDFVPGNRLMIGTGAGAETATITSVGTAANATTMPVAAAAGSTSIKITSNGQVCYPGYGCVGPSFFKPGDVVTIGTGSSEETDTIASGGAGTTGADGSGLTLSQPLQFDHGTGTLVSDGLGTGISFTPPLTSGYPGGTPVTSTPGAVTGDGNNSYVGTGTDPNRADTFTLTSASDGQAIQNAPGLIQGGERFQAITLTSPGTVRLSAVGIAITFDNTTDYQGSFVSSDQTLNQEWYQGVYTVQADTVPAGTSCAGPSSCSTIDGLVDGAKRDRNQWIGDIDVESRTIFDSLGFGRQGSDYVRDAIQAFGVAPEADGEICGNVGNWVTVPSSVQCSPYSVAYSSYFPIILAQYVLYSGDLSFARSEYAAVSDELAFQRSLVDPSTGLVTTDSGDDARDWDYFDGGKPGGVTATNALYYESLVEAAWLAGQLAAQDPKDPDAAAWRAGAAQWATEAANLKNAINSQLFDSTRGVYVMSTVSNGDHAATAVPQDANAEAIAFGIAPPGKVEGILKYLKQNLWTSHGPLPYTADAGYESVISPFVTGYELDARLANGDVKDALTLSRLLWSQMLNTASPYYTGAMWEQLGPDGTNDRNVSLAHGWSTAPVSGYSQYLLGIAPLSPGYQTWTIAPQPGSLSWAQGTVPTPHGPLGSRWEAGGNGSFFKLTVSAPPRTDGSVVIPDGAARTIAMDGHVVWADGHPARGVSAGEKGGAVVFSGITGGSHTFAWVA